MVALDPEERNLKEITWESLYFPETKMGVSCKAEQRASERICKYSGPFSVIVGSFFKLQEIMQ